MSKRKSKIRMNVEMMFWANKLRKNRLGKIERRETGKCQSHKRGRKNLSDFLFIQINFLICIENQKFLLEIKNFKLVRQRPICMISMGMNNSLKQWSLGAKRLEQLCGRNHGGAGRSVVCGRNHTAERASSFMAL